MTCFLPSQKSKESTKAKHFPVYFVRRRLAPLAAARDKRKQATAQELTMVQPHQTQAGLVKSKELNNQLNKFKR